MLIGACIPLWCPLLARRCCTHPCPRLTYRARGCSIEAVTFSDAPLTFASPAEIGTVGVAVVSPLFWRCCVIVPLLVLVGGLIQDVALKLCELEGPGGDAIIPELCAIFGKGPAFNQNAAYHYLASVLFNVSQTAEGKKGFGGICRLFSFFWSMPTCTQPQCAVPRRLLRRSLASRARALRDKFRPWLLPAGGSATPRLSFERPTQCRCNLIQPQNNINNNITTASLSFPLFSLLTALFFSRLCFPPSPGLGRVLPVGPLLAGRQQILRRAGEGCVFQRLLPFTTHESSTVRRGGAVGCIRNCCFSSQDHEWLLSDEVPPPLSLSLSRSLTYTHTHTRARTRTAAMW